MYFVPLTQLESVELVIHSLKAAGGEADCSQCPAHKVCMKQCLTIAGAVEKMLYDGTLPQVSDEPQTAPVTEQPEPPDDEPDPPDNSGPTGSRRLSVVK